MNATTELTREEWLASLKTGDRVMITWTDGAVVRSRVGKLRQSPAFFYVGNSSFPKETGEHHGVRMVPVSKELMKAERLRSKCIKQIEAAAWWALPTETLTAIAALLPPAKEQA